VANDELAYLLDLHLFLGRPFNVSPSEASSQDDDFPDGFIGHIPDVLLDEEHSELKVWHETVNDLVSGKKCMLKSSLQAVAEDSIFLHFDVDCLSAKSVHLSKLFQS
jgi:hypothetical protein